MTFCGLFAVLELVFVAWFRTTGAFDTYLGWSASWSSALLVSLGNDVVADGRQILGTPSLAIESGCDGLQPLALFACAVLAFPVGWRSKLVAIAVGAPALLLVNLVRVVTLYEALVYDANVFNQLHVTIWPLALMLFALSTWGFWVLWATEPRVAAPSEEIPCVRAP